MSKEELEYIRILFESGCCTEEQYREYVEDTEVLKNGSRDNL